MVNMPHEVLVKFCDMLGILIDNDEEIQIQLLTTCNVKARKPFVISDVSS